MSEVEELKKSIERFESRIEFLTSKNKQKHEMCRDLTDKLFDAEERETEVLDLLVAEIERLDGQGKVNEGQLVFDLYQKIGAILIVEDKKNEDEH